MIIMIIIILQQEPITMGYGLLTSEGVGITNWTKKELRKID